MFDRGEVVGAVLTLVDVNERNALEAAERHGRRAAEAASRAKTDLLMALSDEMRAPLEELASQTARLASGLSDPSEAGQLADVHAIQRVQGHLTGLVENIAGFANLGGDAIRDAR